MDKKKVAIFSDEVSGPRFASAATKLGYEAYLFYVSEPKNISEYEYLLVDLNTSTELLGKKIEDYMGKPDGIVSCIEQYSINIAQYAKYIGISLSPLDAYHILRDKSHMKLVWEKSGVRTPKSLFANKYEEININNLKFPTIVKPTHGGASAGVRIVKNPNELKKQIDQIKRFNLSTMNIKQVNKYGFLVEEYINGYEYSIDTIWLNGQAIINGIMSKGNPKGPIFPDRLYFTDPIMDESIKNELLKISHEAVKAAGVISGATHTEVRIKDNKGFVIESALRPGAGGYFYSIFEKALGVSFYEALIIVSMKEPYEEHIKYINKIGEFNTAPKSRFYLYNISYDNASGIIESIEGVDNILNEPGIDRVIMRKHPGDYLSKECQSYSYLGWIIGEFLDDDNVENYYGLLENIEKKLKLNML